MGKGDKKSRKGKIFMGSFGVLRPKKKKSGATSASAQTADKKVAVKKSKKE